MKISIDAMKCQGFGQCKVVAPDLFDVGAEDGYAYALVDDVPATAQEAAENAMSQCPMKAIQLLQS